jgi:hypothetical protein
LKIQRTPTFDRNTKGLFPNQKIFLDKALKVIAEDPTVGKAKLGDLAGVRVYKFKILDQEHLLAYKIVSSEEIRLLMCRPHENFYRDLKSKN